MQRVQCLYSWEQDSRKPSNYGLNQKEVTSLLNLKHRIMYFIQNTNAINPLKNRGYAVLVAYKTLAVAERILS